MATQKPLTDSERKEAASEFTQALAQHVPKESFGEFVNRLQGLFTDMEIAETEEEKQMFAGVIQELLAVEMRDRVDAIAAVICRGEAWAAEAKRLQGVAKRHEDNALRLKEYVKNVMTVFGTKELKTASSRLLVCGNGGLQPLVIDEDVNLPDELRSVTMRINGSDWLKIEEIQTQFPSLAIVATGPDGPAIRAALAKPCLRCHGSTVVERRVSACDKVDDPCPACAATGKRHMPGARLEPRGTHLRVTGSLMLDGDK